MNLLGGPDGAIYVVDMYRGIVQEQIYWTDFLKEYIWARTICSSRFISGGSGASCTT